MKTQNELIVLARKPIDKKTIVENVKEWGTGGINIDGCRVATDDKLGRIVTPQKENTSYSLHNEVKEYNYSDEVGGRFPSNVILDEEAADVMDEQSGILKSGDLKPYKVEHKTWKFSWGETTSSFKGDSGGASRFFKIIDNTINENKINIMKTQLLKGNNLELLKTLEPNSVDAVVCDPPYGIAFMNKKWDYDVPSVQLWKEVYRVLKPGGHILSFGGTRTYHRMVVNIEDAGFEIRDCIQWIYGSGFPKSLNIGKGMDKLEGNERDIIGENIMKDFSKHNGSMMNIENTESGSSNTIINISKGNTQYEGWGTGLKPANEPIVLARKPLDKKTIVENVKEWGTGGINIDGCRIGYQNDDDKLSAIPQGKITTRSAKNGIGKAVGTINDYEIDREQYEKNMNGRFPSNVILDEEAAKVMDEQTGVIKPSQNKNKLPKISGNIYRNEGNTGIEYIGGYNDIGGGSKFFYVAKVSKKERNLGLDDFEEKDTIITNQSKKCANCNKWELAASGDEYVCKCEEPNWNNNKQKNNHPTVKPINLLTYLIRLITPPNGVVLDMYMGSGSTGIAALLEDKQFIGMEMDEEYFNIAEARINNYEQYRKLLK